MADTKTTTQAAKQAIANGIGDTKSLDTFKNTQLNLIFKSTEDNPFLNKLRTVYLQLTANLGKDWHPYINGRYMIFMEHGTWINHIGEIKSDRRTFSQSSLELFQNNLTFQNFPRLATDIDLPQINNEYLTLSTRNQGITYFHRQTMLPDFSISYIENYKDLDIIQYHDLWFKMMELYRRGDIEIETPSKNCSYFYEVPYLNAIWVIIFDIAFQIRGLIYLVGVKPVNHPLKEFLGNRSNSKITVYNIQYKTTNMYYNFFKDTDDFIKQYNDSSNKLLLKFKKFATNISGNQTAQATTNSQINQTTIMNNNFNPASDGYGYG